MPNRIIKESLCTSDKISNLTDFEFRLWVGLITQADDAGRGDARPAIIKGAVFPLRERVTVKDVDVAIHGLAAKGCVSLYTVGGKPYFWFPTWGNHQRIRECRTKYPAPECSDNVTSAANCGSSPQAAAGCGLNPIQSESKSESNLKEIRAARFSPPSVDEVRLYCKERNNRVDPEKFVDFYASKGWKVGISPMKDWKAAVRRWERDNRKPQQAPIPERETSYDLDEVYRAMKESNS